jgi:hypothetical protein
MSDIRLARYGGESYACAKVVRNAWECSYTDSRGENRGEGYPSVQFACLISAQRCSVQSEDRINLRAFDAFIETDLWRFCGCWLVKIPDPESPRHILRQWPQIASLGTSFVLGRLTNAVPLNFRLWQFRFYWKRGSGPRFCCTVTAFSAPPLTDLLAIFASQKTRLGCHAVGAPISGNDDDREVAP